MLPSAVTSQSNWRSLACLPSRSQAITSNWPALAWRAYRAPTPQAWFDLLNADLSPLPRLRSCVLALLEELPNAGTGLGATEMRILELISAGDAHPYDCLPGSREAQQEARFPLLGNRLAARRAWRDARCPPCPVSTRGRSRWRCTATKLGTSGTSEQVVPHRSGESGAGGTEDFAVTTRSAVGGAAPK